ncbi:hypothetical protein OK016_28970 [Vibrio chagasii]|nr:hypothetical protein [Vibrio chagasii]
MLNLYKLIGSTYRKGRMRWDSRFGVYLISKPMNAQQHKAVKVNDESHGFYRCFSSLILHAIKSDIEGEVMHF